MGSGFHTIHHTTYKHNYGHYTVLFDWLFGTLRYPDYKQYAKVRARRSAAAAEPHPVTHATTAQELKAAKAQ
eukprot:scaffold1216_cov357-Prasinococcus_capsulatus_cf.AAC.12